METRICNKCNLEKSIEDFYRNSHKKNGREYSCKVCRTAQAKNWTSNNREKRLTYTKKYKEKYPEKYKEMMQNAKLKERYGIDLTWWKNKVIQQESKCDICKTYFENPVNNLYVDHDHKTGKVRGLLCQKCNHAIGLLKEDIEIMRQAIKYINIHSNCGKYWTISLTKKDI